MDLKDVCPICRFRETGDERGGMVVIEGKRDIPFKIKRAFYIYNTVPGTIRGQHANIRSKFMLINVSGSCKVMITDGTEKITVTLDQPMEGLYIPEMIWKEMYDFSEDSVLLCLASTHYDDGEYIRDFDEYCAIMRKDILPKRAGKAS